METLAKEKKVGRPRKAKAVASVTPAAPSEGRFYCFENLGQESISFRNPDPQTRGLDDLTIPGYGIVVADPKWLDVPWVVSYMESGNLTVFRSNTPPKRRDLSVSTAYDLTADSVLNNQAIAIVSSPVLTDAFRDIILVNPKGNRNIVDKDWLKETGSKFLHNIIERERKWRNRAELIELCQNRIIEINAL